MGHDYSYSQPDSSDLADKHSEDTAERELDALIRMDEAESRVYPPQPEVEHGFPKECYCGAQPILSNCYNRRFFTCPNVDDGEMHIHKWWDVAVVEELRDNDRRYEVMVEKVDYLTLFNEYESEINEKMVMLENVVNEIRNENRFRYITDLLVVCVMVIFACILFMSTY
ncbi:PREDICTED: uncharacterized protein LOC104780121 isoform X2 [Camelina sativa]|uniref:Uncharacterized protein LOC104730757 isoform X2 n=1 Tax=Camelina sativa TaxID=90675 RepID=A0ABM0YLM4_CAMSA|nr:PREDICTED: uncharacterized protein LOC104730757 isoform X2 [Camelina sativa]XP_010502888.2 PREDICTED: uncharacterized protein LOC104780121 isoform X2 [Camelina sativa]XP_019091894.1 PREDICTED: uncharacterized protein LOC104730757 isoform X2 [Camelina sativa]XP_019100122.1 PREDICTED: uncharacterized protein LOC104780121 isoform X2 [Camelina sativa]